MSNNKKEGGDNHSKKRRKKMENKLEKKVEIYLSMCMNKNQEDKRYEVDKITKEVANKFPNLNINITTSPDRENVRDYKEKWGKNILDNADILIDINCSSCHDVIEKTIEKYINNGGLYVFVRNGYHEYEEKELERKIKTYIRYSNPAN